MKKRIKDYGFYVLLVIIFLVLYFIHLPYYVLAPGGVIKLNDRIKVSNDKEIVGSMNLLYVNQYEATIPTYLMALVFKNWDLEKAEEQKINSESMEEIKIRNQVMLDNSVQNAIFVAYNKANKNIDINDRTNYVIATTMDNDFKVGDIVLEVDGVSIDDIKDIQNLISDKEVGDIVQFKIIRDGRERTIYSEVKEENGNKIVGVMILTNYDYTVDPEIEFKFRNSEGGSSGGLMLALTIYDLISDDDIVRGRDIAGTGTINIDGTVGKIDGIKYKIMGAVKKKMDLILVPEENYKEAIKVKKDMDYDINIVKVRTIDDAINYLKSN